MPCDGLCCGVGGVFVQVVSLGVVDPTESKDISLIAVSDAGMRFYLSCGYRYGS